MNNKKFLWGLFILNLTMFFVFYAFYYNLVLTPRANSLLSSQVKSSDTSNIPEYTDPGSSTTSATSNPTTMQTTEPATGQEIAKVISIIDGDTIKADINGKVEKIRLLAIDTPETKDPRKPVQCYGLEATKKITEIIQNKKILLTKDATQGDRDKYGRLLRYVYLEDGTNVNAVMVKEGYAFAYRKYPTSQLNQMIEYEKQAKDRQAGLWSPSACGGKV